MKATLAVLLSAVATSCLAAASPATGVAVFHAFSASEFGPPTVINGDGASPAARLLVGSDGTFYGTASTGGVNGAGTIFSLATDGTLTDLYDFKTFLDGDGIQFGDFGPNELVQGSRGLFFGSTQRGGANRSGTIIKVAPAGGEIDIYTFSAGGAGVANSNSDGFTPSPALVMGADGNFYGTTQAGGANGNGTIFQVTPAGTLTTLYSFGATDGNTGANTDGANPNSLTLGADGNFYGTTELGGNNGVGTFFQVTSNGVFTPLYYFGATAIDAEFPQATLLLGPDGNFYGTSAIGGHSSAGTVFKATAAGAVTVLYSFTGGNDGGGPSAPLALGSDGNLYGVTDGGAGTGTIFKITTAGAFTTVYSFPAMNANSDNTTGAYPSAGLVMGHDGNLYGTCLMGGANGNGTIFRYTSAAFSSPFQPPIITTQPAAKIAGLAGTFVTLNTAARGVPPFTWQWVKNRTTVLNDGGDTAGSATSSLVIGPLQATDAGSYSVIVTNAFGMATSAVAVVTVSVDTVIPTIKILSPLANARSNSPVLAGTATDNGRVTNVVWWITNRNGGSLLTGAANLTRAGSNWDIPVIPLPGTNILAVQSMDASGHSSKIVTQTFFYKATNAIGIFAGGDGAGSVGGGTASVKNDPAPSPGAVLNIGEGYAITAVPSAGSMFSNWVGVSDAGNFTSNGAKLSFVMQTNLILTANFTPNFYLAAHGIYNGLFSNTNEVAAESSGMLQGLALGTNGAFTAKLVKGATIYSFAGTFNVAGLYSTNLGVATAAGGKLNLSMALDHGKQQITGTVSNTLWSANLSAEMTGSNIPSAEYTFLLAPPAGAPSHVPPGDGYAAVTNHLGQFTFSGKLADGMAFTPAVAESKNGNIPVYSSLYGNTGILTGWINLAGTQTEPPTNVLTWIKKASRTYPPYTNGFTNLVLVQGSPWMVPAAHVAPIPLPMGDLVVSNSTLLLDFNVAVSNNNAFAKLPGSPTNSLAGTITPKTGVFTLTFGNGIGRATTAGQGALLQAGTNGGGYFLGPTNAGSILLIPPQ